MTEFIAAHPNNYRVGRDGRPIQYIIIHSIVGSLNSCIKTFQSPTRIASAHNIVGWNGREVQMVTYPDTAYHAGNWEINLRSIGIEHDDQARPWDPRPDVLYEASARRVASLCIRFGIPCDRGHIKKHSEVSLKGTACPAGLDIDRIVARAKQILTPVPPTPPPPPPTPEWKKNLKPINPPHQRVIEKDVPMVNIETGAVIKSFTTGSDITVHYLTSVKGVSYYMTRYSVDTNKPYGFNTIDFDYVVPPTTTSTTSYTTTITTYSSSSTTQLPPVVDTPSTLVKLLKNVIEWVIKILNTRIG